MYIYLALCVFFLPISQTGTPSNAIVFPRQGISKPSLDASLTLGLKTLQSLDRDNGVVSPANIYTALTAVYHAAGGEAKNELLKVLNVVDGNGTFPLLNKLSNLFIANAVFVDKNVQVKYQYFYEHGRNILLLDFSNPSKAIDAINSWVSNNTKQQIPQLLSEPLSTETTAVIVSALYFEAEWLYPFVEDGNKIRPFHVTPTETVNITFMTTTGDIPVYKGPNFKAFGLPYAKSGYTLYILLPNETNEAALKTLLSSLSADVINEMATNSKVESSIVMLPKLLLEFKVSLKSLLKEMGVEKIFDSKAADFSDLTDDKVFIDEIIHQVRLEIDEVGTRGAAVTAAILTKSGKKTFKVDNPFAFVLRHSSGHVIFLGSVNRPKA